MLNEKIVQFHDGEKRREGDTPSLRQNAIQVVSNSTKTLTQGQGHVTKVTLSQGSPVTIKVRPNMDMKLILDDRSPSRVQALYAM